MGCVACEKEVLGRFEDFEDSPQREFIEENWARCGDWSVCKQHEKPLAELLKRMIELGVNPEVNPKIAEEFETIEGRGYKEWLRNQGKQVVISKYDSDYTSFILPKRAAKLRRQAIDEIEKLKDKELGRAIIKAVDGAMAEAFMAGIMTPNSWSVITAYDIAFCIISDLRYEY